MRVYKLLSVLIVLLSSIVMKAQNDDVYYDPSYDRQSTSTTTSKSRSSQAPQYADNTDRNADSYDNQQYDSQYYEYGDDYDDYQYSSRISRFQRPYRGFGYYDNAYVDNFYYDPFYYNRWFTPVVSVSFGKTSERAGSRSTSSKVRPSGISAEIILRYLTPLRLIMMSNLLTETQLPATQCGQFLMTSS